MSENVNISFIPKKSLAKRDTLRRQPVFGISFVVSLTVTLVSIGFATSGYFALNAVEHEKNEALRKLDDYLVSLNEEKLFEKINEERAFVQRTKITKSVLDDHIAPSKIFTYLEETTPTKVVYRDFSYKKEDGTVSIGLRGDIGSYGLLASLSQWYKNQSDYIDNLTFGGFSPNNKGGVSFNLSVNLDPDLILYVEKDNSSKTTGYIKILDDDINGEIDVEEINKEDYLDEDYLFPDEQLEI